MPRTNRLDRFSFGFLQNPDFLLLAKPTLLHFVLSFFFAQNSTFATSSFWGSGHLDTRSDRSLWKDRALVELNAAVLHSFAQAGVAMVDHHTVARQFMLHQEREMKAGRTTNAY